MSKASLTLLVDGSLAGAIIGKGGSTLRAIKSDSGVSTIQLSQDSTCAERVVQVSGQREGVHKAYGLIAQALRAESLRIARTSGRGGGPASSSASGEQVRLVVPNALAALLLAGQGALVRRLRKSSGASIEIGEPDRKQREIVCVGSAEQTDRAVAGIVDASSDREASRHRAFLAQWKFETDYLDHFETPRAAYADVLPLLRACAAGGDLDDLTVYDPYYCKGAVREALAALGCRRSQVINENRDFYVDARTWKIPKHDVLLTNPPYSGNHKQLLLDHLLREATKAAEWRALLDQVAVAAAQVEGEAVDVELAAQARELSHASAGTPFMLLLPAWVAATDYWRDFVTKLASTHDDIAAEEAVEKARRRGAGVLPPPPERLAGVFYVSPRERYTFAHPQETGHATSPFHAVWFCGGWQGHAARRKAMRALRPARKAGTIEVFRDAAMLQRRGFFQAGAASKRHRGESSENPGAGSKKKART